MKPVLIFFLVGMTSTGRVVIKGVEQRGAKKQLSLSDTLTQTQTHTLSHTQTHEIPKHTYTHSFSLSKFKNFRLYKRVDSDALFSNFHNIALKIFLIFRSITRNEYMFGSTRIQGTS